MSKNFTKELVETLADKLLIGLIPLSETVHEVAHSGRLFIPVNKVLGRYNIFLEYYEQFCDPEQLETLRRIEKYTEENSDIEQNKINYQIEDNRFLIPQCNQITDTMINRIEAIKNNNYLLPIAPPQIEKNKEVICPIYFE